jgi:hypothetical protein
MTKYLVSAAAAAIVSVAAFAAPASAQGFSVGVNAGPGYHDGYRGDGYRGDGYRYRQPAPAVRVYTGRNAYRGDCYTKQTVKWRNGKKIIRETRICD